MVIKQISTIMSSMLSEDMVGVISQYCPIHVFNGVSVYCNTLIKNRAAVVITTYFKQWLEFRNTPCHPILEHGNHLHICLSLVKSKFNEFDDEMKSAIAEEYLSIRFDNMLTVLGINNIDYTDLSLDDDNGYKKKLHHKIVTDYFNDITFDVNYVDNIIEHDFSHAFEDGRLEEAVIIALSDIFEIIKKWDTISICDAIERFTNDEHTMLTIE